MLLTEHITEEEKARSLFWREEGDAFLSFFHSILSFTLFSHNDWVDGDEDDLNEDTEEAESSKANKGHPDGAGELVVVGLFAALNESFGVGDEGLDGDDEGLIDEIHFFVFF